MKKILLISILSALITPLNKISSSAAEKIIYGDDNRTDYYDMPASMQTLSNSVVSLWKSYTVDFEHETGLYRLFTNEFGRTMNLCVEERFRKQPVGAFCSGSLVGDDMIMTAGHCIKSDDDCANTTFVFGFKMKKEGEAEIRVKQSDVYFCKEIVTRFLGDEATNENTSELGADYALIKLTKPVIGRKPLQINREENIKKGTELFVIGHPVGLPVKLANDSSVRNADYEGYFEANLDTYGGNSGSPVFNAETNLIEGILVRGDTDFVTTNEGCVTSNVVPQHGGRGEDVTKVAELASFIPKTAREKMAALIAASNTIKPVNVKNILSLRFETKDKFNLPTPSFTFSSNN